MRLAVSSRTMYVTVRQDLDRYQDRYKSNNFERAHFLSGNRLTALRLKYVEPKYKFRRKVVRLCKYLHAMRKYSRRDEKKPKPKDTSLTYSLFFWLNPADLKLLGNLKKVLNRFSR